MRAHTKSIRTSSDEYLNYVSNSTKLSSSQLTNSTTIRHAIHNNGHSINIKNGEDAFFITTNSTISPAPEDLALPRISTVDRDMRKRLARFPAFDQREVEKVCKSIYHVILRLNSFSPLSQPYHLFSIYFRMSILLLLQFFLLLLSI